MDDEYLYREGFDDPIPYYNYIVHLLHESKMVEDPDILDACEWFTDYGESDLLKKFIDDNPDIIKKPKKKISELSE